MKKVFAAKLDINAGIDKLWKPLKENMKNTKLTPGVAAGISRKILASFKECGPMTAEEIRALLAEQGTEVSALHLHQRLLHMINTKKIKAGEELKCEVQGLKMPAFRLA